MKFLLFLSVIICFVMCSSTENHSSTISPKCRELNDSGTAYIKKYVLHKDTNDLNIALTYLDNATACDSNFTTAYSNKLTAYTYKNDTDGIMQCNYALLRLTKYSAASRFFLATTFEQFGYKDSAHAIYVQVNKEFKKELQNEKEFDFEKVQFYLLSSAIIYGAEKGAKQYDSIYAIYRNDPSAVQRLQATKPFIDSIESRAYLSGMSTINMTIPIRSDSVK